ncbi:MAG: hypothetical protein KDD27_27890 [Saprospiraceae bacterium]|nr:hypothetical protein [Saprospiraceae bacterium]
MQFYTNGLFHIYNQGNNRQQVFFSEANYLFFLWKMRAYLLPFGDLVAYSLMPNHFHWLFYVKEVQLPREMLKAHVAAVEQIRKGKVAASDGVGASDGVTLSHAVTKAALANHPTAPAPNLGASVGVTRSHADTKAALTNHPTAPAPYITLNESIGILQRSYTRAINKSNNRSGSLFREKCKAEDGWIAEFVTLTNKKGQPDYRFLPGSGYASHCLNYIHLNAVEANLVRQQEDWPYSSAKDYAGQRNGNLCNIEMGKQLMRML